MFRVLGIGAVLGLALLSISGSNAEDRDEFYAIARGETGRRAAPAPAAGSAGSAAPRRLHRLPRQQARPRRGAR